ncbi:NADH dehydrogenase [Weissella uvarum]|uniref:NAD(P)/FAD-dependent oxidoreductase n=1 Tax=Weissella uvarum TaxID=1479233 RepID=UPI0019608DF4|nr:NAD(P)/FAD-dependent oxidoreductase [Weissella uvarum]MBM7616735.1 NADH dehydrogenase [Weissella uvarum]MCM0594812.1 NAD(P)/FAD-dependent oxidoreductase [Weissella uvarum]
MATKNIVVVGAGFAGVTATRKLAKQLKGTDYQIVLVDKHSFMTYMTELHEVATGRVTPEHVRKDLQTLFKPYPNVKLVTAEVSDIDKDQKVVKTSVGEIPYEKLVLATGGTTNTFGTPGVYEYGFTLWSYEEAIRLRKHIEDVVRRGAVELDPKKREAMLHFVIVGSGFTGAELAGELMDQRHSLVEENGLDESEIKIDVIEAAPSILNMLSKRDLADKAQKHFEDHDIHISTSTSVTEVKENAAVLKDGTEIPTNTLIWTAGVKANDQTTQWGLELGPGKRFLADEYSRAKGEEDIYVAGDTAAYQDPKLADPNNPKAGWTPQTVEGAESASNTVVPNLVYDLTQKGERKQFKGRYQGYAVSIGSRYAVGVLDQIGNMKIGKNGIGLSGFFANLFKHAINIYFYLGIHSWYYLGHYLRDEFFNAPDRREPFFGWASRRGNVLFTVPLRIILGIILIFLGGSVALSGTFVGVIFTIIGWLLTFGLFTSAAGFVGIIMTLVLIMQPNLEVGMLLFALAPALLAVMNGSGRVLGLDYWVMPWLERKFDISLHGKHKSVYDQYNNKK